MRTNTKTAERRERREREATERHRRHVTATLHRLGVRYCSCSCGRWADDLLVQPDGSAIPMAHHCAQAARRAAEVTPA
jgi:hypothetical protein